MAQAVIRTEGQQSNEARLSSGRGSSPPPQLGAIAYEISKLSPGSTPTLNPPLKGEGGTSAWPMFSL